MGARAARVGREVRAEISKTVRDVMLLVVSNLKNSTPVDTGHAQSNWIVTTKHPFAGVDGSRTSVSHAMQDRGITTVMGYDVGRDGPLYLRNNVHYIKYLNRGHSQQAPAGFVTTAIMAALRRAPYGRRGATRRMLHSMSRRAIDRDRGDS